MTDTFTTDPRLGLVAIDRFQGNRRGIVVAISDVHYTVRDKKGRLVLALISRTDLKAA